MSSNLPIKKESKISRFFNYIKALFRKESKENIFQDVEVSDKLNQEATIVDKYKVYGIAEKIKRKQTLEQIIDMIEQNPDALYSLDTTKLEIIDTYYKEKIMECRKRLGVLNCN